MWAIQSEVGSVRFFWIPGFGDAYVIGDDGSLWSRYKGVAMHCYLSDEWTRLNPIPGKRGYLYTNLSFNGVLSTKKIHKLVCEAVHGPCPSGEEVRHLDGNKLNNDWKNLIYGTPQEQYADRVIHGTSLEGVFVGEYNPSAKLTWVEVREIRVKYATRKYTQRALALEYGVCFQTVNLIVNNLTWVE